MLLKAIEDSLAAAEVKRAGDDVVVVACSGGLDSVVLTHATCTLLGARRVVAAHVDHGVREGSGGDAAWVEAFVHSMGAEVQTERVHSASDAEADLRDVRYAALERIRVACGATWILTAHHRDDQAEQVLISLLRTGSITPIPARRDHLLRPMLGVSRDAVRHYAERHHLEWREDPTNTSPRYLRNRVRKELLPLLERRYRPGIAKRLAASDVRDPDRGSQKPVRADEDRRAQAAPNPAPIRFTRRAWADGAIPDGRAEAVFDADAIDDFVIRPLVDGDRIRPFGHLGRRKVRDILREGRIPASQRPLTWIVEAGGEVVWVPGLVRSDAAPVQETTTNVWVFWTAEN